MRRLMLLLAASALAGLAACDEPRREQTETAPPPVEAAPPPPVETAPPTDATTQPAYPPADNSTLPPDQRQSEETVKPESETLFY